MRATRRLIMAAGVGALAVAPPAAAGAKTKSVTAGPPAAMGKIAGRELGNKFIRRFSPDVDAFFRQRVTINQGDTVSFSIQGFHTIDLPGKTGAGRPLLIPSGTVSGLLDAAGNPFWFNGRPNVVFNPALLKPTGPSTYNGSSRIDTGLPLGPSKPLKVKFTRAGTYKYYCAVHPGMVGYVVVKPKGQSVPSAKQDAAAVTAQIQNAIKSAKADAKLKPARNNVSLGESSANGLELFTMFPATLRVKAGTVVRFSMSRDSREVHTASFGPAPYLGKLASGFTSLKVQGNAVYPSEPTQPISLAANTHGNGFGSTGTLDADRQSPLPPSGRIRFTQPGTYHFICLIHPFMHGTVVVTK